MMRGAGPSLAAGSVVRLDGPSLAKTGLRAPMPETFQDDSDRALTECCLQWCFLIWFPREPPGDPEAKTDIMWDGPDRDLLGGDSFKRAVERMAGRAIKAARKK